MLKKAEERVRWKILAKVGILPNPLSGKDIRRLVACGTVSSNHHKVNIVLRLLLGLNTAGVKQVVMLPDIYGIGQEAREKFFHATKSRMEVLFLDMILENSEEDSYKASLLMKSLDVGCIVTVGGDGTNRMVAKASDGIPILPISTGTNNVFPFTVEGTVAGLAAGLVAKGMLDPGKTISQRKRLDVLRDDKVIDIALVDAVVTTAGDIGSKAVWEIGEIKQIVQTCGSLSHIGLSSIGGCVHHIDCSDRYGLSVEIGNGGITVVAPIAPGLIKEVGLKSIDIIAIGDAVPVRYVPSIVALDGERQLKVLPGNQIAIRLSDAGPKVVEVFEVLKLATENGIFATMKNRRSRAALSRNQCRISKSTRRLD